VIIINGCDDCGVSLIRWVLKNRRQILARKCTAIAKQHTTHPGASFNNNLVRQVGPLCGLTIWHLNSGHDAWIETQSRQNQIWSDNENLKMWQMELWWVVLSGSQKNRKTEEPLLWLFRSDKTMSMTVETVQKNLMQHMNASHVSSSDNTVHQIQHFVNFTALTVCTDPIHMGPSLMRVRPTMKFSRCVNFLAWFFWEALQVPTREIVCNDHCKWKQCRTVHCGKWCVTTTCELETPSCNCLSQTADMKS